MRMRIRTSGGGALACPVILWMAAAGVAWGGGRPPEIQSLADQARSVPPEFAAEALLRLAASDKVTDRQWKHELLEEAFRQGGLSQQPWKRVAVNPRRDPSAAFQSKAFAQNLDADSLQCRAVKALLPLDKKKARELFAEIPAPQFDPLTCSDTLVYDVSLYYETLAEVANTAFTPKEIADDEPFKLVERSLRIFSPVQVGPVANLLAVLVLKPDQRDTLLATFSGALAQVSGDPRSFAAVAARTYALGARIGKLAAAVRAQQSGTYSLIESYRAFLVRNLSGARCQEEEQAAAFFGLQPAQPPPQDAVGFFNDSLRQEAFPPGAEIKAIAPEEIQPAKVEEQPAPTNMCQDSGCRQLVSLYRAMVFDSNNTPYRPEARETSEWRGRLRDYLAALADWKEEGGPGAYFRQKCALYSDLFNLLPKGPERDEVMRSLVAFLNRNSYQREHRAEWFLPVNTLIGRIFADPYGLAQAMKELRNAEDRVIAQFFHRLGQAMKELRNAEDRVIALFANLEQAAPR